MQRKINPAFRFFRSRVAILQPPPKGHRHGPSYQAQKTLQAIANGTPRDFSEAAWQSMPWRVRFYGLRRVYLGKGRGYRYLFDPSEPASGIASALEWMMADGWAYPPQSGGRTSRGGVKTDAGAKR